MNLKRLLTDTIYLLLSTVILKVIVFLSNIYIANSLGAEFFGKYGISLSTANMIGIFAGLGLSMTIVKYVAEFSNSGRELSYYISSSYMIGLVLSITISSILYFKAGYITSKFFDNTSLTPYIKFASFIVLSNSILALNTGVLQGLGKFKEIFISNILLSIVIIPLYYFSIKSGDLKNILIVTLSVSIIDNIFKGILVVINLKYRNVKITKFPIIYIKNVLSFAIPTLLSGICFLPFLWYSKSILIKGNNGLFQSGLFDAAYQWITIIMLITGAVASAIFPMLSRNNNDFIATYKVGMLYSLIIPIALIVIIFPFRNLISSFYGPDFDELKTLIPLALTVSVFFSLWSVMSKVSSAKGKPWQVFVGNLVWCGCMYTGADYYIKGEGVHGLLLIMLYSWVSVCVYFFIQNYFVLRRCDD
ncbi:oligosaccharide flippase family protein [Photobacterium phosphoreum]|uniref:oligosaccharide flippase family protein n=1 Tax=Photobacterium phosphoreum TaxID=659 RepID=UPI0024B6D447|nr:oligosaccharide flippase family protein [Photobacterium phosphoreum]